jgi:hypothetical protein
VKSSEEDSFAVEIVANPPKRTSFAEEDRFFVGVQVDSQESRVKSREPEA